MKREVEGKGEGEGCLDGMDERFGQSTIWIGDAFFSSRELTKCVDGPCLSLEPKYIAAVVALPSIPLANAAGSSRRPEIPRPPHPRIRWSYVNLTIPSIWYSATATNEPRFDQSTRLETRWSSIPDPRCRR